MVLVVAVLAVASLEAFLSLCLGSHLFRLLIQLGWCRPRRSKHGSTSGGTR